MDDRDIVVRLREYADERRKRTRSCSATPPTRLRVFLREVRAKTAKMLAPLESHSDELDEDG